ncbi:MAG: hypothetical protein NVS9B12_06200 [Vulcanimicrobiaceae bacterium]
MIETIWTTAADGVATGARHAGKGDAAIVFVHGVGSTAAIWDYQLDALAARYSCYAVELRGNGRVPNPPPERIDRAGFVRDVLAVVEHAGLKRFHFVGCSLGGVAGFELWRQAAAMMLSITFLGSFAKYPNAEKQVETIIENVTNAGSLEAFARSRVEKILPPDSPRRRIDETVEQMAVKSLPSYIASTRATWTGDYRKDLAHITIPALVVCGELDPIAPVELSEEIAAGIPDAGLRILPVAGHVANADSPQRFNEELMQFLESVESTA